MIWFLVVLLLACWILGLFLKIAGGLIHLLLVLAVIMVLLRIIRGRRAT